MPLYASVASVRVFQWIHKAYRKVIGPYPQVCLYVPISFSIVQAMQARAHCKGSAQDPDYYYSQGEEREEDLQASKEHQSALSTLVALGKKLKNVDEIDGRLAKIDDNVAVFDVGFKVEMQHFKRLAQSFLGFRSAMHASWTAVTIGPVKSHALSAESNGRDSMTFDSLRALCEYLGLSVQQRRHVRKTIAPQVTQYYIWRGALEELLKELNTDLEALDKSSNKVLVGKQAIARCIQLLNEGVSQSKSPSWVKLAPCRKSHSACSRWGDVLELFDEISTIFRGEEILALYISKIESMKEGLYHIKDVWLDNEIDYKQMYQRQWLVKHKLVQNLGNTSECLFTLLTFYLFQKVRNIKVDISGGLYQGGDDTLYLCMGEVVTSGDTKMLWRAIKHLDRALNLCKFICETACMGKMVKLQGHIWTLGAQESKHEYRGNTFFIHDIESE